MASCQVENSLYISKLNSFTLVEFVSFRRRHCQQHHSVSCKECSILIEIANYIKDKGIVKVSDLYHKFFPGNKYKSDKAVRRLLQLPVAIFALERYLGSRLHVTEYCPSVDYKRLVHWINKLIVPEQVQGLDKSTLTALCKLASSDKDRTLLKFAACEGAGLTSKQARKVYGIASYKDVSKKVRMALQEAAEIRQSIIELAEIEDKALMRSLRLEDAINEEEEDSVDFEVEACEIMPTDDVCDDGNVEDVEPPDLTHPSENTDTSSRKQDPQATVGVATTPSGTSNSFDHDAINRTAIVNPASQLATTPSDPNSSYDPDAISKTKTLTNPAPSNDTLLSWLREHDLNWFTFFEEVRQYLRNYTSEVLNHVILQFTDHLPFSDLTLDEEMRVEVSRQAFLEVQRRRPLDEPEIEADSDNDEDQHWEEVEITDVLGEETLRKIQSERLRIRRRAERRMAKEIAKTCILKRRIPPSASRLQKKFPTIGKDMEEFVESKKVGADAWRRTGLFTFDGERRRGKKVTYKSIQAHLEEKYNTKIGYGSIVQLCYARNKRRLSTKRYQNVAKITCRRARKEFSVQINPDAHWSCALYRGLDYIQLKEGSNKVLLNRDDQSGFRLDTTYDHKHSKTITLTNRPALTTRTDFVNDYPSVIQTTSYLFMETDTSKQACVGVVKPHFTYPKNAAQHAADLELLQNSPDLQPWVENRPIDCIRVDGASDEGPSHVEVQFYWTERHVKQAKVATLVTSRHSGGSYLNRVELMNGGLSQAHANLFIPSTLSGSNYGPGGLDKPKLKQNLEIATEVYIDRVQGSSCCGSPVQLFKGAESDMSRCQKLLTFLKGNKKDKELLRTSDPDLHRYFQEIWDVRNRHMSKTVPSNYIFHLTLCGEPECIHPHARMVKPAVKLNGMKVDPQLPGYQFLSLTQKGLEAL